MKFNVLVPLTNVPRRSSAKPGAFARKLALAMVNVSKRYSPLLLATVLRPTSGPSIAVTVAPPIRWPVVLDTIPVNGALVGAGVGVGVGVGVGAGVGLGDGVGVGCAGVESLSHATTNKLSTRRRAKVRCRTGELIPHGWQNWSRWFHTECGDRGMVEIDQRCPA